MSRLRFNITMTLDGYVAGPKQSVEHPLGEGADHIHDWLFGLKTFQKTHGLDGPGNTGTDDDVVRETSDNIGPTIMGRNMFGGGSGPWGEWRGWWGIDSSGRGNEGPFGSVAFRRITISKTET